MFLGWPDRQWYTVNLDWVGIANYLSVKRIANILMGPTHIIKLYLSATDTAVRESSRTHLMHSESSLDRWAGFIKTYFGRSQLDFQSTQKHYYVHVRNRWVRSILGRRRTRIPNLELGLSLESIFSQERQMSRFRGLAWPHPPIQPFTAWDIIRNIFAIFTSHCPIRFMWLTTCPSFIQSLLPDGVVVIISVLDSTGELRKHSNPQWNYASG